MRRAVILSVILIGLLVFSTTGVAALHRAVYYCWEYPTWWIDRGKADDLSWFFEGEGYEVLDAYELAEWMQARIEDKEPSVVIFAMDAVPDTIWEPFDLPQDVIDAAGEPPAPELAREDWPLIREYLVEADGKIVWMSDIPFWYVGRPFEQVDTLSGAGCAIALGFYAALGPWDVNAEVTLTDEGIEWGLTDTWNSVRANDPDEVDIVLAVDGDGYATAWVKNFTDNPYTGFVRLYDTHGGGIGPGHGEAALQVAEYFGP